MKTKEWTKRNCFVCKKEFIPNTYHQKYCSKQCQRYIGSEEYALATIDDFKHTDKLPWFKLRILIFDRDGFKCFYCGRNPQEDNIKLEIDHKIPRNKGGKNNLENLITACFECNQGKKDILLDLWKKKHE